MSHALPTEGQTQVSGVHACKCHRRCCGRQQLVVCERGHIIAVKHTVTSRQALHAVLHAVCQSEHVQARLCCKHG